jgi:hypothetical protein
VVVMSFPGCQDELKLELLPLTHFTNFYNVFDVN